MVENAENAEKISPELRAGKRAVKDQTEKDKKVTSFWGPKKIYTDGHT